MLFKSSTGLQKKEKLQQHHFAPPILFTPHTFSL